MTYVKCFINIIHVTRHIHFLWLHTRSTSYMHTLSPCIHTNSYYSDCTVAHSYSENPTERCTNQSCYEPPANGRVRILFRVFQKKPRIYSHKTFQGRSDTLLKHVWRNHCPFSSRSERGWCLGKEQVSSVLCAQFDYVTSSFVPSHAPFPMLTSSFHSIDTLDLLLKLRLVWDACASVSLG